MDEDLKSLPVARSELCTRWFVLIFLCGALFGSYYAYDNPTAVNNQLEQRYQHGNTTSSSYTTDYNLLYSVYSFPNMVLPFFGGVFSDKWGFRLTQLIFTSFLLLGQIVFALGATLNNFTAGWWVMWTGRTIFGFGGESLSVVQSAMIAQWFQGKEQAMALGANLAIARVGSVANDLASVVIANETAVYWAFWVGALICALGVLLAITVFFIDRKQGNKVDKNRDEALAVCSPSERKEIITRLGAEPEKEEIYFSAVLKFPLKFWVLSLSCVLVYATVLPFNNIASNYIIKTWLAKGEDIDSMPKHKKDHLFLEANEIMMVTYLVAGFMSPVVGRLIDQVGKRAYFNLGSSISIVGVHCYLRFSGMNPIYGLAVLGVCYSIYASALWPCVPLVVPVEYSATAYGVITALQNSGLALTPVFVGLLQPPGHCGGSYNCVENLFITIGLAGVASGIWLFILDTMGDGSLNRSPTEAKKMLAASERLLDPSADLVSDDSAYDEDLLETPAAGDHDVVRGKVGRPTPVMGRRGKRSGSSSARARSASGDVPLIGAV